MPVIVIIAIIIFIARQIAEEKKKENKKTETAQHVYPARPAADGTAQRTYGVRREPGRPQTSCECPGVEVDADHYHQEGCDFETCFSFRNIPRGTDELSALIAANSRHEEKLEKMLQTREA